MDQEDHAFAKVDTMDFAAKKVNEASPGAASSNVHVFMMIKVQLEL